jgi:hypothetical protein
MSVMMYQMNRALGTVSGLDDLTGLSHGLASRTTPPPGDTDAGRDMGTSVKAPRVNDRRVDPDSGAAAATSVLVADRLC